MTWIREETMKAYADHLKDLWQFIGPRGLD